MTITRASDRGDGPNRFYCDRFLDDAGAPAAAVFAPGFKPRRVMVLNLTDRIRYEWHAGMPSGTYIKTIANGTVTLETDSVLLVTVDVGVLPSITLAAAATLQNKQYQVAADA